MRKLLIGTLIAVMLLSFVIGSAALPSGQSMRRVEANAGTQWNAAYYNNKDLSGSPSLQRVDDKIDFNWGNGSPDPAVNADGFSARWTKTVNFPTSGKWVFHVEADDSLRMWIDSTQIVAKWNAGGFWTENVTLGALTAGNHELKVEYKEETAGAQVKVWWEGPGTTTTGTTRTCDASWNAQYFNNGDLAGDPALTRVDPKIDFNWGGGSPDGSIGGDTFSARWTTALNFPQSGHWRFYAGADDGINIWIDVTQILDEWHTTPNGYRTYEANIYELTAGKHDIRVEYFEETGNAGVQVCWEFIATTPIGTGGGGTGADGEPGVVVPTAVPPAVVYAAVVGDAVNVRTGPGRGNPVMAKIPYNEDYLVVAGVPDLSWLLIDLRDGREGWVSNAWVYLYATDPAKNEDTTDGGQPDFVDDIPRIDIEIAPPAYPEEDDPLRVILTGSATDTLNLRDGPSVGAARVIGSVPQNAIFQVEAHNGNGAWYLIQYQGIRGWVSALYVRLLDGYVRDLVVSSEVVPAPPFGQVYVPEDNQGNPSVTVRGRATSNVKLRSGPSLITGEQIGSVPLNGEFAISGRTSNGSWYLITWEGQQGWINAVYVTLLEGTVSDIPIQ